MKVRMNFVLWLTLFFIIFEGVVSEDGWMQLEYISIPNECLTVTDGWHLKIERCSRNIENSKNQLWRWDKNGHLQNNKTGACIHQSFVGSSNTPFAAKLERCDASKERLTCLPYALKTKTGSSLVYSAYYVDNTTYSLQFVDNDEKGRWRRFNDPAANICDYTGEMWRPLDVSSLEKIETGLSFFLAGMRGIYLFVDGEIKRVFYNKSYWTSVSVGPAGIWLLPKATHPVVLWINNTNAKGNIIFPQEIGGPFSDSIIDIDVGPTGLVFIMSESRICARIGINDTQSEGSAWNCTSQNAELLSCGIDGYFFVNGINITYQPENKTLKMQQFFTPFQCHILDIDAGLNYELWVVTDSHDVYRRVGTNARLPWGSNWKLVPGIQLDTISIGVFGPVGILASSGNSQAVTVILNGVPTPERQQELDRLCNETCSSESKSKPCLARFRSKPGETSELRCHSNSSLSGDTQYPGSTAREFDAPEFKKTLFKRPLLGRYETHMWLDYLCNDPNVNPVQGLRPSAVNYFAEFNGHNFTCRSLLDEVVSNIDEKLEGLTKSSCAQIPLGLSSGMFPSLGFSGLHSRNGQPRFQNDNPGWCSNETGDHLEIDFFFVHEICALKLGGNNQIDRWILQYSLDGSDWLEYIQKLKGKYEETQILPVYIKARYLRFKPVIESNKTLNYCLKLEVYGSSQAFKADSCVYYGKRLQATNDGIYIIYPSQGTKRQLVYCTGLRSKKYSGVHQFRITSPDLKLPLHLKPTSSIWYENCFKCRNVFGNFTGIRMSLDETANLGDFRGTCISDPETCLNGLSFELWLDFVDFYLLNSAKERNIILNSGSKASRGFQLSVTNTDITFSVFTTNFTSNSQIPIPHFYHWVHIVGSWDRRTMIAQLFVDKVNQACVDIWARNTSQTDDGHKGELKLRPIAKIGKGFVVAQNLSIWMRRITDKERQELFKYPTPKVSLGWSSWSACTECEQYRHLECGNEKCDVDIVEFQTCYNIRKCGLRMNWPLDDKTSKPCSTCRHLVASSALILPTKSTVHLDSGMCEADFQHCVNGLTIEVWIWFAEYWNIPESESTILQSGFKSGFRLTAKGNGVAFTLLNGVTRGIFLQCTSRVHFNRWNHVVVRWVKKSNTINFHVDNIARNCTYTAEFSSGGNSDNGRLVLGPIANDGQGYVVAQNLSVWMQAINDEEFHHLLQQKSPKVPGPWSNWTKCAWPCKQMRYRNCSECDVKITETRLCYHVHECGLRMNWPLDDKTSKPCSTCRHLVASSALILPTNSKVNLGHFNGTCVADLQHCVNGLTMELWIWFAEYDHRNITESESTILQSGFKSGFRLTAKENTITFVLLNGVTFLQCTSRVHFSRWNHVVIRWVKESDTINFHVDNITSHCMKFSDYYSGSSSYDGNSEDGKFVLGPIANVGQGYVVAQKLSVWMQAINDEKFHHLLQQKSPKVPGPWSNWTKCAWPCKQMRYRNCSECDVKITETRLCYRVHECGLRIGWSLQDLSNLTWEGGCSMCRDLVSSSALVLPMHSSASLGNFAGKCVSELHRCVNGLTFETWLWFAEYNWTESESMLLQSGDGRSRFQLSTHGERFHFKLFTGTLMYKCKATVHFNSWNHIVASWNKELNITKLAVNHNSSGSCYRRLRGPDEIPGMVSDGRLLLGPILKVGYGYVVTQNLSIWMRALSQAEIDFLLEQPIPETPASWNSWSRCLKPNCTQKRERKCRSTRCTVNIRERKDCLPCPAPPSNCDEIPQKGNESLSNGIYSIHLRPHFNKTMKVFCEQTLMEGGWLVILNRKNGNFSFNRGWDDYKLGFGDLNAEHWIGNENLHQLTKENSFKLMIYFSNNNNTVISETTCDFFRVASESERYAWNFKLCEGPASHALSYSNGAMFSTNDSDNDLNTGGSCAKQYGGGFWYKNCSKVRFTSRGEFVSYLTENGSWVNMFAVTMMIKPYKKRYVEMNVVIRFVDEKWSEELASNATHSFFLLAGKIKHNIQEVYRGDNRYISATVNSFSQGSVIANIIIAYFNITGRQVVTLVRQLDHGYLNGIMAVSYNYSDFRIINSLVPIGWPHINELYNTSSKSFNVSWSYMKNMSHVQGFRIYFKSLQSTQWKTVDVSKHVFQTEVTDLKEFTVYEVLVSAYSLDGDGLPSPIRNVTTDEGVPEIGPPNLTVYWNKTNFAVHVTWSQIPQPFINGYLTHYVITYSNSTHSIPKTSRTNSSVLTGLPIFSQYTIDVVGATRIGTGQKSEITYRTRGLPLLAPTNLTATNMTGPAINVSWTPIPDHPNFDKVVGYRMYYNYLTDWKNLTVPVNKTHVIIHVVKWNVHLDITVAGLTVYNQEGQPASTSIFLKNITAPKWPPLNLSCRGVSPYSIVVGWYGFTVVDTGGSLKGYKLSYFVKGDPEKIMNVTIDSYQPWYTLENLHAWTEYEIRVLVYNEEGFSPLAKTICKTSIGVPDAEATPQNLQAHSYVSDTFITLSWPHVFMNGTRRGYRVNYRKVSDAGSEIKDSRIEAMTFSGNTTEAIIPGLDVYSKYCFELFALNENFPSKPSNSVCAETCRCPPRFYTNWFIQDPYVVTSSSGIFPPLVKRMIAGVCGPCKAYNDRVVVEFKMDGNGETAQKTTSKTVQLVKAIDATQVSFPVVGPKTGLAGRRGAFIPIIKSPMSAFITRKPVMHTKAQFVIEETIVNTLPLLAFTFVLLLLGAMFIWAAEYKSKEDAFPKPFHKGIQQGFWWAFVSVTTVGYGDKIPTSKAGRLFSVIWILYGTVFIGVITASLSTSLNVTFVVVSTDVTLYNSHVAAIDHSLEVQLGLLKGARVNEGRNFSDVNTILKAVENGDVDGALIDKLTAARLDNLSDPNSNLIVKNVIPKPSTYGIFLAGDAIKLRKKFQQFLQNNADFVTEQIQNYTQPLKEEEVSSQKEEDAEQTSQANILSGSSPIFLPLLLWLVAVLIFVFAVGLVWHFIYYKHVAKAAKKNQVCAVNESRTGASPLQQFVKDFHKETYAKLRDMKSRHIAELKTLRKLKTR